MRGKRTGKFRWLMVKGTIDNFRISGFRLWPVGSGGLFMPVRMEIRKAIGKKAGDTVRLKLAPDDGPPEIPGSLVESLKLDARAEKAFFALSADEMRGLCEKVRKAGSRGEAGAVADILDRLTRSRRKV